MYLGEFPGELSPAIIHGKLMGNWSDSPGNFQVRLPGHFTMWGVDLNDDGLGQPGSGLVRNSKIYQIWRSQLNSRGLYLSAQMELDDVLGHLKSVNDMNSSKNAFLDH